MTNPLLNIITETINNSATKRITFADYMNLVLYHDQYGYYSSGKVKIGNQGDFFTSSSLGSDFGELLAEQFSQMGQILDYPSPFTLVEMGAGSGLLANDILNYLETKYPEFYQNIEYLIIEQSPSLITQQQELLKKWLDKKVNLCWKTWQEIADNSLIGCCFSNELIDAFPVHKIIVKNRQIKEIYLTINEGKLIEISDEISTPEIIDYFNLIGIDLTAEFYPENYQTEVNLAALAWLKTVSSKLQKGYLLTIDYGYPAEKYYHPQRYQGTLQCYYQHRYHDNPYLNIGQQDITTHVDFTALQIQGKLSGLETIGFTKQGMFLMSLGLGDRLSDLSTGKYNFQEILHRRDALHQLIDPQGLGGFGVLIQGKGLTDQQSSLKGLEFL